MINSSSKALRFNVRSKLLRNLNLAKNLSSKRREFVQDRSIIDTEGHTRQEASYSHNGCRKHNFHPGEEGTKEASSKDHSNACEDYTCNIVSSHEEAGACRFYKHVNTDYHTCEENCQRGLETISYWYQEAPPYCGEEGYC